MKPMKTLIMTMLFSALLFWGTAAVSHAAEHSAQDIQMLQNAAAALMPVNPGLGEQLRDYADDESEEAEEAEEEEMDESQEANIKLLNDSAAALEELADGLKKYAAGEAQESREGDEY